VTLAELQSARLLHRAAKFVIMARMRGIPEGPHRARLEADRKYHHEQEESFASAADHVVTAELISSLDQA
jgi:hypothetical protein